MTNLSENYERFFGVKLAEGINRMQESDVVNEFDGDGEEGPAYWFDNDGWNTEAFEEIGLMDILDRFARVQYELDGAQRGSYGVDGETIDDLVDTLSELCNSLQGILEDLSN